MTHGKAHGFLMRCKELASAYAEGGARTGPLHFELNVQATARQFGSVHSLFKSYLSDITDIVIDNGAFEVVGAVDSLEIGRASMTIIDAALKEVVLSKGGKSVGENVAGPVVHLANTLGGCLPQSALAKHVRDLARVCSSTGALILNLSSSLGGAPLSFAIPVFVQSVRAHRSFSDVRVLFLWHCGA